MLWTNMLLVPLLHYNVCAYQDYGITGPTCNAEFREGGPLEPRVSIPQVPWALPVGPARGPPARGPPARGPFATVADRMHPNGAITERQGKTAKRVLARGKQTVTNVKNATRRDPIAVLRAPSLDKHLFHVKLVSVAILLTPESAWSSSFMIPAYLRHRGASFACRITGAALLLFAWDFHNAAGSAAGRARCFAVYGG